MKTGQLRQKLVIQRDATQPGPSGKLAGQPWREPADVAEIWCHMENATGGESVLGGVAAAAGQYNITTHRRTDITRECRLLLRAPGQKDRVFQVIHVEPLEGLWMRIRCEEAA
jgi:head-tail adaptor